MNWLKNYERIISIEQQLVWQPVSEIDPRTYVPEVSASAALSTLLVLHARHSCASVAIGRDMKRPCVRPSVCLSVPSCDRCRGVRRFAAERRADGSCRSTAAAPGRVPTGSGAAAQRSAASASSVTFTADVGS